LDGVISSGEIAYATEAASRQAQSRRMGRGAQTLASRRWSANVKTAENLRF
jgi:hypothetical protein